MPVGSEPVVALSFEVLDAPTTGALQLAVVRGLAATSAHAPIAMAPITVDVGVDASGPPSDPGTDEEALPTRFALYQNSPNPFIGSTSVRFDIARSSHARIVVYDLAGRAVRVLADGTFTPGRHAVTWSGAGRSGRARPGIYFLVMEAARFRAVKRLVRLE